VGQRWVPDEQLIPAIRTGRCPRRYTDLSVPDRAWVILGLAQAGMTAEHIAELLGCSLRTVWVVRADPITKVLATYLQDLQAFQQQERLLRSELSRMTSERDTAAASAARLRAHLVRVTAPKDTAGVELCSKGLHPMTRYNTYEHGGRRWCRECRRITMQSHRERRKIDA
jgi:Homeodomain-like domain